LQFRNRHSNAIFKQQQQQQQKQQRRQQQLHQQQQQQQHQQLAVSSWKLSISWNGRVLPSNSHLSAASLAVSTLKTAYRQQQQQQ